MIHHGLIYYPVILIVIRKKTFLYLNLFSIQLK